MTDPSAVPPVNDLALRIRQARIDAGLSQRSVAEQLGLDRSAIAQWERQTRTAPTLPHLSEIARLTGVTVEWLATGRGHKYVGGDGSEPPPVIMDFIAQSEDEERLLVAYRRLDAEARARLLARAEGPPGEP